MILSCAGATNSDGLQQPTEDIIADKLYRGTITNKNTVLRRYSKRLPTSLQQRGRAIRDAGASLVQGFGGLWGVGAGLCCNYARIKPYLGICTGIQVRASPVDRAFAAIVGHVNDTIGDNVHLVLTLFQMQYMPSITGGSSPSAEGIQTNQLSARSTLVWVVSVYGRS
jgi:CTP synthase (UTP-ammonia lyase)